MVEGSQSQVKMMVTKNDSIPVRLPGRPPQDVFVNFRIVESSNVYESAGMFSATCTSRT